MEIIAEAHAQEPTSLVSDAGFFQKIPGPREELSIPCIDLPIALEPIEPVPLHLRSRSDPINQKRIIASPER